MERYKLTKEHQAQLAPWRDKWIANAMSTAPMDDAERDRVREAVRGLYRAAGLTPPPDNRIVFVPSPFVARFAGASRRGSGIGVSKLTSSLMLQLTPRLTPRLPALLTPLLPARLTLRLAPRLPPRLPTRLTPRLTARLPALLTPLLPTRLTPLTPLAN